MALDCPDCGTINDGNPKIAGHTANFVKLHPCDVEALQMQVGIEATMAPLGCLLDVDGNITHKVFLCKTVSEDETTTTFRKISVELATGNVTDPYDGPFEDCPGESQVLETDYCYVATGSGTGYSEKDIIQYSILSDLSYVEWFNQSTGVIIYSAINGVPSGVIPNLNDLEPCASRPEIITPQCYQWVDPLLPNIVNIVSAYASVDIKGNFCEWVVTEGTAPPDLTLSDALVPCRDECTPASIVYVNGDNYSLLDAELFVLADSDPALELLEFTAHQLSDFNLDMIGNVTKDPLSTGGSFDGRVVRIGQLNLKNLIAECLLDADAITLVATLTATRDSELGTTVSGDGSLIIADQTNDLFLASTVIAGGADGLVTAAVSASVTKSQIEDNDIVVLLALQTQDGVSPIINGVDWLGVHLTIETSTVATCPPANVEIVKDCGNDERNAILSEIRDRVTPSWVTNAEGVTDNDTVTGIGSTASGLYKVAFYNSGGTTVTVDGGPLIPGVGFTHTGYHDPTRNLFVRLPAIPYDATGGSLQIVIQE